MEKKIKLEEIFLNNFDCYTKCVSGLEYPAMSKEKFVEQVKFIVEQLLELAAETAEVSKVYTTGDIRQGTCIRFKVNKQSILDTINQIE